MSFIVAFIRSLSFLSSSSSVVSNFLAPVTTLAPGRRESGRKFAGSGFFSAPVNNEKFRQSKDMDRR
jgi:hypothetical protein